MRTLIFQVVLAVGVAAVASLALGDPRKAPASPDSIVDFEQAIQTKGHDEIVAEAVSRFGPYLDDGVRVGNFFAPSWTIEGGLLSCDPLGGPTYSPAGGGFVYLLHTKNPLAANLHGSYEMITLPTVANPGSTAWIGVLEIQPGGTYHWSDANNGVDKGDQSRNFFIAHPDGTFTVGYPRDITGDSLLENLGGGVVASLDFRASTGETFRCELVSDALLRLLSLNSADLPCELRGGWKQHWPARPK